MKNVWVLSLFPEYFEPLKTCGVIQRAFEKVQLNVIQIRDHISTNYKSVDDYPYGGGAGQVMRFDYLALALEKGVFEVTGKKKEDFKIICPSPRGKRWDAPSARDMGQFMAEDNRELVFVCGRYEGIDERFLDEFVDEQWSVGDYVLSGGELAVLCMLDSSLRFYPELLGNKRSAEEESFEKGLLEYPHYTRPSVHRGRSVPKILLSGHHRNIENYRFQERKRITQEYRKDLWEKYSE